MITVPIGFSNILFKGLELFKNVNKTENNLENTTQTHHANFELSG